MAAKIWGAEFGEQSRFSVLGANESESSEEENPASANDGAKKKAKNAKKRARKKKKAAADSAATAELRKMAFGGSSKQKKNLNPARVGIPTYAGVHSVEKPIASEHQEWIERDEQFIINQFQEDLQEALRLSVEETNFQKTQLPNGDHVTATKKRKDHSVKLSLDEFQKQPPGLGHIDSVKGIGMKELDRFDFVSESPKAENTPKKMTKRKGKVRKNVEEMDKSNIIDKSIKVANDIQVVNNELLPLDAASVQYWKNEVEEKDKELDLLRKTIVTLKEDLAEVKKRNKQLCFILGQGEMRDKAEILQQVDSLTSVRDELSSEISELHSQLEQERSKVSSLRIDLARVQTNKPKKHSNSDSDHR